MSTKSAKSPRIQHAPNENLVRDCTTSSKKLTPNKETEPKAKDHQETTVRYIMQLIGPKMDFSLVGESFWSQIWT